ncbi:MAG TPA: 30S ribosomal protein S6 [Balneolaceae bacterium]|nr:30S ribosomal protein S6 [Balneolaceae bacterium]
MSKNYYEQTYIIDSVLEDDQYKEIVDKYRDIIEDNGGEIDEIDEWGIKKFAYDMNGKSSGYYVNTYFEAPGELIEKLERAQRIDDNVMRFLTLKYDAKMLRHRELQKKNAVPQLQDSESEEDEE